MGYRFSCLIMFFLMLFAETVRLLMSMQVDRVDAQRIFWSGNYLNPNSVEYQTLEGEASYAIDSSVALTSLSDVYVANRINRFFPMSGKVTVNATLELISNAYTTSTVVKRDIQRKLIQVIQVSIPRTRSRKSGFFPFWVKATSGMALFYRNPKKLVFP